jgi:GH35 family endo-1,4-beta-xylanase
MLRIDVVWSDVHRGPFLYDFSRYDLLISKLSQRGIKMLVLLHYNKLRLDSEGREVWSNPPDSFEEFARYVHAAVSRYKDRVHHWEIWNEPNHPVYWSKPKDKMKTYVDLLKLSYKAAKQADPTCFVINGGITEPVIEDVQNFYEQGGGAFTDAICIHTFLNPNSPIVEIQFSRIIEGVQQTMRRFGDVKKRIWITEMGCPGLKDPQKTKDWWCGQTMSEEEQAAWLERQYEMIKRYPIVEKLFWAFYRDTENIFKDGTDHFGLVSFNFRPKPAFYRFKNLIQRSMKTS